jgi:branched-chain amino acid aminotransferase
MMIWRNGELLPTTRAIDATDRGVTLGDGIFETMAVKDGAPLRVDRHLARLANGLKVLGFSADIDADAIREAAAALVESNNVAEGALRLTVLRGSGARGVLPVAMDDPTVMISLTPATLCDTTPLHVIIATCTRLNDQSPMSRIKSTNYGDAILARMEADRCGADDALMLNTRGTLAEATTANVFCVIDGALITPPLSDGALPGVMREMMMERTKAPERSISTEDLYQADEVFVTSSLSIRPVVSIDGQAVGDGQPGLRSKHFALLPGTAT